jgi:dihydroorotase
MRSFGFRIARGMLAEGFVPDVISSDVHVLNVDGPVFDLLATLSKFYCLGLDLPDLIGTATCAPAAVLRRPDLGTLRVGATGDATVIAIEEGRFDYHDCVGEVLDGGHRLACRGVVRGGEWVAV